MKNVEVKEANGSYYLYGYNMTWNSKLKRTAKKTKYLGVLKEKTERIREHGHVSFIVDLLTKHGVIENLQEFFPFDWEELLLFSINRVIDPAPLKRIGSWMDKTTLGSFLNINPPSGKKLSKVLKSIGEHTGNQKRFMEKLVRNGELLLYDGSVIYSDSRYNKLLEIGYDKNKTFLPKANITLLFSKDRNLPINFRVLFGSVHEINTMKSIIEGIKEQNVTFIGDKGYYKYKLYDDLMAKKIDFIFPLPRDDKMIRYKRKTEGMFEYRNRIVEHTAYYVKPYWLYTFRDQRLAYVEKENYCKLKLKNRRVTFHEEWVGKITLISNRKLDAKEAYTMWKTRDLIKKAFHVLQNFLETDHPYVSSEYVFRGYLFASFISLFTYYCVLNSLQKHGINEKVSVADILFEFSKVMLEDEDCPNFAEIPAKVRKLAKEVNAENILVKLWES